MFRCNLLFKAVIDDLKSELEIFIGSLKSLLQVRELLVFLLLFGNQRPLALNIRVARDFLSVAGSHGVNQLLLGPSFFF